LTAFRVSATSLHIALEQVMIHRVQYGLWNLRTGCVVEKGESRSPIQRRKAGANGVNGKARSRGGFGTENALGLGLQTLAPKG
jgi:hypothetical protein